jgi:hypothetical protein
MPRTPRVDHDEEIIRDLVAYSDRLVEEYESEAMNAYRLVQIYLDIDHILNSHGPRNPRKLLDSMNRLSESGNE